MVEKLAKKVDNLVIATSENSKQKAAPLPSSQFSEKMKESYSQMNEWKKVNNIVELVSLVKDLELFPMSKDDEHDDIFHSGGAILRCKTCFSLYKGKAGTLTPAKAAKKLAADCNSICTGRYFNPEKMSSLVNGEGVYWRKLKSSVLKHMICAEDGQTHFKALTMLSEERNLKNIHYEAAETMLKSALTAVKSKSGATHYEDQIAFAYSVGAQVGQCGHSRKLVPDMIKCLLAVINEKTREVLLTTLPSTGIPPHYYMAVDKATVNKRTNQGVIICPRINGKRVPIIAGAPEVYSSDVEGTIHGSKADESATQALDVISKKFGKKTLDYLIGKYSFVKENK